MNSTKAGGKEVLIMTPPLPEIPEQQLTLLVVFVPRDDV
jgi:hypothetical protein